MTINTTDRVDGPYTSGSVFPFYFKVFTTADVLVVERSALGAETVLTLTTDYTVTLNANQDVSPGGSVTRVAGAVSGGISITITSAIAILQGVTLNNNGAFFASVISNALDRLTIINQQQTSGIDRSLKFPLSDSDNISSVTLPTSTGRASKALGFDGNGDVTMYETQDISSTDVLATGTTVSRGLSQRFGDYINALDFGMGIGQSGTYNQGALQDAVTAAFDLGKLGVYIPPALGSYTLDGTVVLPNGCKLIGGGWGRGTVGSYGTTLVRGSTNSVMFTSTGTTILSGGPQNANHELTGIRFSGNDLSADMLQFVAVANLYATNCMFSGTIGGRLLLLHETFDSRFLNCYFGFGGNTAGTVPAVELKSGSSYEVTNQIHFNSSVFESYYGTAVASSGSNTNEIFFNSTKMESLSSNKPALNLTTTNLVHFNGLQITSKGTLTNTISAQIVLDTCTAVVGTVYHEHISGGATLTNYISSANGKGNRVTSLIYDSGNCSGSEYITVTGTSNQQSFDAVVNTSGAIKQTATSGTPNLRTNNILLFGPDQPHVQFRNGDDTSNNRWYLGRVDDSGVFYCIHYDGSSESGVFRLLATTGEMVMEKALRLAQLSSTPTASAGQLYYDNSTGVEAIRQYVNGSWKHFSHRSAAPAAGTWEVGDIAYNTAPTVGGTLGWVCVTAGTPGTWAKFGAVELNGSATWNPGDLVDGAGETSAGITATGAALGDFVLASAPYDLQGITCNAYVSAADTVTIRLQNETGGAINLASGTWKVRVIKA